MSPLFDEAKCIGCGCTDNHACLGSCYWLVVDYKIGRGVCSNCPGLVDFFQERVLNNGKNSK